MTSARPSYNTEATTQGQTVSNGPKKVVSKFCKGGQYYLIDDCKGGGSVAQVHTQNHRLLLVAKRRRSHDARETVAVGDSPAPEVTIPAFAAHPPSFSGFFPIAHLQY